MRYSLAVLTSLAWALWLGGLITLFVMVSHLFRVDRTAAIAAAPKMFVAFERYQIILAAAALIATTLWRLTTPRAILTTLFFVFAIASIGTITSAVAIVPKMEQLRLRGMTEGLEFRALHGRSMLVYSGEVAVLLLAGFILPAAIGSTLQTAPAAVPPSTPPDEAADRSPLP